MSYDSQSFELIKLDQACRKLRSYQHDKKKIKMRQLMTIVISLKNEKGEENVTRCWEKSSMRTLKNAGFLRAITSVKE